MVGESTRNTRSGKGSSAGTPYDRAVVSGSEGRSSAGDGRARRWEYRRPELLAAATGYALEVGVAELTLRPLAEAIGTSITSLNRQFGSKDALIRDVCRELHAGMVRALEEVWERSSGRPTEVLRALWELWLAPEYDRQFAFLFELYGMAIRDPERYTWFADSVVRDWMAPLEAALIGNGHSASDARTISTLVMAVIRGLRLDVSATRDTERVRESYEMAMALLEPVLRSSRDVRRLGRVSRCGEPDDDRSQDGAAMEGSGELVADSDGPQVSVDDLATDHGCDDPLFADAIRTDGEQVVAQRDEVG